MSKPSKTSSRSKTTSRRSTTSSKKELQQKGRYTPENQQEDLGIAQFAVLMAQKGWPFSLIGRDTGEDLIARIFDKGNATGLDFLVQHKSVRTSRWKRFLLVDGTLSFPLEVPDLKHWRSLLLPVVLVVWNVEKSEGRWLLLQTALQELDKSNPLWEKQEEASLHLPHNNTFDEQGLFRLRWELIGYVSPLIPENEMGVSLDLATGQFSTRAQEAISRFVRFGDELKLQGEEISALQFSQKWKRLLGPNAYGPESVVILSPSATNTGVSFRFDLLSHTGRRASVSRVEMRRIQGGTEQLVLSNVHEHSPLIFTLVDTHFPMADTNGKTGNINVKVGLRESVENEAGEQVPFQATPSEAQEAMEFLDVLADGGTLRVTLLDSVQPGHPKPSTSLPFAPNPQAPPEVERQRVRDFYNTVQEAEVRFSVSFSLSGFGFKDKDLQAAEELRAIFLSGRYIENRDHYFSVIKEGCLLLAKNYRGGDWKDGDPVSFWITSEEATISLLGVTLPLGGYEEHIVGPLEWTLDELEARANELNEGESLKLRVVNARIIHTFAQWLPKSSPNEDEDEENL